MSGAAGVADAMAQTCVVARRELIAEHDALDERALTLIAEAAASPSRRSDRLSDADRRLAELHDRPALGAAPAALRNRRSRLARPRPSSISS